jgi:hypothetical protein
MIQTQSNPYTASTPSERRYFRENFRAEWKSLKEIGQEFDISAIKAGRLLVEMGLRNSDKTPSEYAIKNGFCWRVEQSQYSNDPYWLWHGEKTVEAIDSYLNPDD